MYGLIDFRGGESMCVLAQLAKTAVSTTILAVFSKGAAEHWQLIRAHF